MAWTDIDPAHEDEFNRWYDTEQIGRLLAVPGVVEWCALPCVAGRTEISRNV